MISLSDIKCVVDVADWPSHPEHPVFPVGSKPKRLLLCPEKATEPFLIPNHAYLFKAAHGWQQQQVWSEVIAYRLGQVLGLDVPPAYIAVDSRRQATGVLIEFFYGFPGEVSPARMVHASDFLARSFTDLKRGRPHGLKNNLLLSRTFVGRSTALEWWAKTIVFDALIGNRDRHPENWGFLVRYRENDKPGLSLAPRYDNGTSLSYEISDERLDEMLDPERVARYIERGVHHCGWDIKNDRPVQHAELCSRLADAQPDARPTMLRLLDDNSAFVSEMLENCSNTEVPVVFSRERARVLARVIEARRKRLVQMLEAS